MRITNNMMTQSTKGNINGNKINVDNYNNQMTTQKKISKPSEDPVIAIRSLRLSTSLSHILQYADNNIPDAASWLDVTETALTNMKSILTDIRTQCVNGSTDTLTTDDRKTILKNLSQLSKQVYTEGNADYAGRTVFSGYRTDSNITFDNDEEATSYAITQKFTFHDMEEHRYYTGDVNVPETITYDATNPANTTANCTTTISEHSFDRIRLAYDKTNDFENIAITSDKYNLKVSKADMEAAAPGSFTANITKVSYGANGLPILDADGNYTYENATTAVGNPMTVKVTVYESQAAWEEAKGECVVDDDELIYIKNIGEFVIGEDIANSMKNNEVDVTVDYTKTGFKAGEARPEYYYDCTMTTKDGTSTEFKKEDQMIQYTIANSTLLTVNTQASEVFDTSIARDVNELMNVVQKSLDANEKVDKIKSMMKEERYSSEEEQAILQSYLDVAIKEADYADHNLQKTYEQYITNFDNYLQNVNESITNVGSTKSRLTMTRTRVENQETTIKELKSSNEDRDLSDIIIDYYASYNAYQASLTAASKINQQTLLNYL